GKFDPAGSMTRGMVVTVLYRMYGSPEVEFEDVFTDVKAGKYYSNAVIWAKNNNIVNGVSEGKFDPSGKITREQLATMLNRYAEFEGKEFRPAGDLSKFPDADKAHSYAKNALIWATDRGLITGVKSGDKDLLDPRGNATREQFAAILKRYCEADLAMPLEYNTPAVMGHYTEKEYPLVTDADVYVATDGADTNPGTFDEPVATWGRAADLAREKKAEKTGDVIVAFKAGDYGPLSVDLTAGDSGTPEQKIIYCKYGDGEVVFNNGLDITESDFEELSEEEKTYFNSNYVGNIKKADVSSVIDAGNPADSMIIFYDGGLCDKARFPNKYPDGSDQLFTAASYNDKQSLTIFQPSLLRRLAAYDELSFSTMETYGYIIRGYRKDSFKVASFDNDTKVLQIANWETSEFGVMRDWAGVDGLGIQLCLTNIPKELDNTHEYWINPATKTLYAFAPEGTYHIPVLGTMVNMEGVNDVTFRGLTFRNTSGSFIRGELCHGVTLELCTFCGVSSTAGVYFNDNTVERPMGLTVRECDFSCAYGASLYVNGQCKEQNRYLKRTDVVFDNNQVSTSNLVYDVECAVDMPHCSGLSVTHNRFCNTSRGAFSFSHSYDVNIEYNEFTGIMKNSEDGGAVYSNGSTDGWHVTVRHNFFDYMPAEGTGTFGYYVDDDTCGVEICNNLFYDAANPVMIHLGRDNVVHDNVFIHGGVSFSVGQRNEIDELGLEGAQKSGGEFRKTRNKWTKVFGYIETYLEFRAGIEQWCPEVLNYHLDYNNMDDPYFVMNPVNTVKDNVYINSHGDTDAETGVYTQRYVTIEGNRGFTFEENPMFVNPTLGDYRLRADAEDFPDIEFEKIGRY
ncbi:MAG: S-layer homology domain-containing protein, partial [Clostridia bacterium]|nr:S-layer homology domain-containing protein [Clostridia bacterium]